MMAWALRMVLAAAAGACLVTTASAADDTFDQFSVAEDKTLLTEAEKGPIIIATQLIIITAVVVGVVLLFYFLIIALLAKLYPEEEEPESYDAYSYYNYDNPYYTNRRSPYGSNNRRYYQRSLADNESFLTRVLNSIDPVESAFAVLQVDELACRRRTVCELQQAATRMPLVASLVDYISPSVRGLEAYKEAQEAGSALEDCALLFSECPTTVVQNLWGNN